jgi:hypothetical protein
MNVTVRVVVWPPVALAVSELTSIPLLGVADMLEISDRVLLQVSQVPPVAVPFDEIEGRDSAVSTAVGVYIDVDLAPLASESRVSHFSFLLAVFEFQARMRMCSGLRPRLECSGEPGRKTLRLS